ncbi:hypothetical protein OHS33_34690 [Streptomyces sp. NBC_00536]|uniref:hypothetical protein n=1 Tax=Streptomyces sp. NBC_00536 TaxID=2975769 RepID=UPI002E80F7DF|nr:hypothetical protein [Streptomyces sp. NBC_00536]WUC83068.1 hypothetical protein OHS33_34690 [Streptomyces sp. NBC_00536]
MPNFVGEGMKGVRCALSANASITVKDAVQSRMVLQESNWKVCTQGPKAGVALIGQPVAFTVAKTEETCPWFESGVRPSLFEAGGRPRSAGSLLPSCGVAAVILGWCHV